MLYLLYGVFVGIGAYKAHESGQTGAALGIAGIAAVLLWKATQRVR